MKNFDFIQVGNESMKSVANNLRNGNKMYASLSQVLKDIQRSALMRVGYKAVFEGLGLPSDGNFSPQQFRIACVDEQYKVVSVGKGKEKHEEKRIGIWGWKQSEDVEGNKLFEADGTTPKMEPVLRVVTAWTPNKLFKVLAQANALKAAKA